MESQKRNMNEELEALFHAFKDSAIEEPWNFKIWDTDQKYFFFVNNQLIAAPLYCDSSEQLVAVVPNVNLDQKKLPIFLGLSGKTKVLSCVKSDKDDPQLVIVDKNIMDLYRDTRELKNFSFFPTSSSGKTCCFESAAFPGWFLSTSLQPNKPVNFNIRGGTEITVFFSQKSYKVKF
ncbi:interleukin-36 receptor antagonist protein-like [Candoia aspera]|uniref:interleukin-36 receptor antagonist protein-like n=1 Tax=Candoia aspera TaxID=51853 RepID=UPI002FD849AE